MKVETAESTARTIVAQIERDLTDRRGLRHAWEGIDEDVQEQILETWRAIVRDNLVGIGGST